MRSSGASSDSATVVHHQSRDGDFDEFNEEIDGEEDGTGIRKLADSATVIPIQY